MSRRRPYPLAKGLERLEFRSLMHAGAVLPNAAHALARWEPAEVRLAGVGHQQDFVVSGHLHLTRAEYDRLHVAPYGTPGYGQVATTDRGISDATMRFARSFAHMLEFAVAPPHRATTVVARSAGIAAASVGATVTVQATTANAYEGGQPGVFTITRTGDTSGYLPVNFQIAAIGPDTNFDDSLIDANGNGIALTTANGVTTGTATIPYGQPSTTVRLIEGDDTDADPGNEQDQLTLKPPSGGCCCCCGGAAYTVGSPSSDTITLIDNDVSIQGPTGGAHASEGPPAVPQTFVVSRTGDTTAAITIQLSTAGSTAVPGVDYNYSATTADDESNPVGASVSLGVTSGSVTIPAGYSRVAITINPLDPTDTLGGPTSKVVDLQILGGGCCNLGGPGYGVDSPSSATLTLDDPDGGTPVVSLATGQTTAIEDVQTATFTVSRNGDDGSLAPVNFLLTGASATSDYQLTNDGGAGFSFNTATGEGTISFGPTQTAVTFTVTTTGEVGNKGLNLAMEAPPNGPAPGCCCGSVPAYGFGSPSSATLTLGDAPLAATGVDFDATLGQAFTLQVATFTDGDLVGSLGDYSAQIAWGDGHTSAGTITADQSVRGQFDVTGTDTYTTPGEHSGVATITDAGVAFLAGFIGVVPGPPPLPNITINGAQYVDNIPDKVSFSYSIAGTVPSFRATLFYSKTGTFNPASDQQAATQVVTTGSTNPQTGTFTFNGALTPDATRPYLVVVADPSNVIAESNESDNTSNSLPLPALVLIPDHLLYTLMDTSSFTVTTTVAAGTLKVQGRRAQVYPWMDLGTGSPVNWVERVAGKFEIKGAETIGTVTFYSAPVNITVQFPNYATIVAQPGVVAAANSEWTSTKQEAANNSGPLIAGAYPNSLRREHAYWITLDTGTGTYSYTPFPPIYGPWVDPNTGAYLYFGSRPSDVFVTPSNPQGWTNIQGSAVYVVAALHTHTPMTYRSTGPRDVGPSNADGSVYTSADVAGIVYDYTAPTPPPPGLLAGEISAGWALNSPAQLYPSGPLRRSTPNL